jgi:hypothetical protein
MSDIAEQDTGYLVNLARRKDKDPTLLIVLDGEPMAPELLS